jgi:ABC-type sugar transport system ATPase subunit
MTDTDIPYIRVSNLAKRLGGVQALADASLEIRAGEVHGLVGANGAGKSTLIRSLAGLIRPDSGTIEVGGVPVLLDRPKAAEELGLAFIHQELNLIQHFSILENLTLGARKRTVLGLIDWRPQRRRAGEVAALLGLERDLRTPVSRLSVAEQWLVAIGRALMDEARVIAMDEPTASLSRDECERLFTVIEQLARSGVAILYVSHRLDEIVRLCARVTVFRDGRSVETIAGSDVTREALVAAIVGRALDALAPVPARSFEGGEVVLEVRGLSRPPAVRGVDLVVRAGEILGIGGLVGSGRSELARLIFGADRRTGGEVIVAGRPVNFRTPADAVAAGVALVPEERRSQGVVLHETIRFNVGLPQLRHLRVSPAIPIISRRRALDRAADVMRRLAVKAESSETIVASLSGGNQQKVAIGKWLGAGTRLIILDEPTRGVDIGARQEIYKTVQDLAAAGLGVIMISSELGELSLCDRVIVLSEGTVAGEILPPHITEAAILAVAYSARPTPAQEAS